MGQAWAPQSVTGGCAGGTPEPSPHQDEGEKDGSVTLVATAEEGLSTEEETKAYKVNESH